MKPAGTLIAGSPVTALSWQLLPSCRSPTGAGTRVIVGVNRFVESESRSADIHRHVEAVAQEQSAALAALRRERDGAKVSRALTTLEAAARSDENLLPALVETVETYATVGEICDVLRGVLGEYQAAQVY